MQAFQVFARKFHLAQLVGNLLQVIDIEIRRGAVGHHVSEEPLWVGEQLAGDRAHQPILAGKVGLAGAAQTLRFPSAVTGHHVIDAVHRKLQGQHTVDTAAIPDRGQHPRGGLAVGGRIVLKVGQDDLID